MRSPMKTYRISTNISASPERTWHVLTRILPQDPTPFGILRLEGAIAANSRLKLWSEVDPKRAFALQVIQLQAPRQMVWQGGMPLGLFTGTRSFTLNHDQDGTRFEMKEVFSGLLSSMIVKSMPDLNPSFEKFARALKERAEQDD